MTDEREQRDEPEGYEAPQVDDVPAGDGPAVTAASGTGDAGAEWRPSDAPEHPDEYDAPQVADVPADDGPAVTAAGGTGDGQLAAEWRGHDRVEE